MIDLINHWMQSPHQKQSCISMKQLVSLEETVFPCCSKFMQQGLIIHFRSTPFLTETLRSSRQNGLGWSRPPSRHPNGSLREEGLKVKQIKSCIQFTLCYIWRVITSISTLYTVPRQTPQTMAFNSDSPGQGRLASLWRVDAQFISLPNLK